jgi:hypothetical protein
MDDRRLAEALSRAVEAASRLSEALSEAEEACRIFAAVMEEINLQTYKKLTYERTAQQSSRQN